MATDEGIANALLRSVVKTLDLCTPCKSRILDKDAATADPGPTPATNKGRILEDEEIAAASRASLASGSTASAAILATNKDCEIEADDTSEVLEEEDIDIHDTASDATVATKTSYYDFNVQFRQSSTSEASFTRSCFQLVVVDGCTWSNVTFTDCRLSNVVFKDVVLRNAHFRNVDFENVTFRNLELADVEWMDQFLVQAVLSKDSKETRASPDEPPNSPKTEIVFPLLSSKATTRTRGGYNAGGEIRELAAPHRQARAGLQKINLVPAFRKTLSNLPDSVLAAISSCLLPKRFVSVEGRIPSARSYHISTKHIQLRTSWEQLVGPRRTYVVRHHLDRIHPAILRVSRRFYQVATPLLYDRLFCFSTHLACLAFLHDHQKKEHKIKRVKLNSTGGTYEMLRTILDVLLHERCEVEEIRYVTGKRFWEVKDWQSALRSLCVLSCQKFLPLQDFHHLQDTIAPYQLLAKLPLKHDGHDLAVNIIMSGHEERLGRTDFLGALRDFVHNKRSLQPETKPIERDGSCKEKQLEQCCHWERQGTTPFKRYELLHLPDNALKRVMQYLFPMDHLKVMESPQHIAVRWRYRQTTFKLMDTNTSTTYLGWKTGAEDRPAKLKYKSGVGIAVNFLRASRRCCELGTPYLYSSGIMFDPNPSTCLAFLHDHRRDLHQINSITLDYNQKSSCDVWRRLFNVLVHNRPDLHSLTIKISSDFWCEAPWRPANSISVSSVMDWKGWCTMKNGRPCCGERTFLHHIARVATKDRKGKDIRVELQIEESDHVPIRQQFLVLLNDEIYRRRYGRPSIAVSDHTTCYRNGVMDDESDDEREEQTANLKEMQLESTCYWEEYMKCSK